jgi:hypothetical protein
MDVILPAFAQRVTVFGSTRNIVATSAGVSSGSASGVRVLAKEHPPRRSQIRLPTSSRRDVNSTDQILPLVQDVRNGPSGSNYDLRGLVGDTPFSSGN